MRCGARLKVDSSYGRFRVSPPLLEQCDVDCGGHSTYATRFPMWIVIGNSCRRGYAPSAQASYDEGWEFIVGLKILHTASSWTFHFRGCSVRFGNDG